MQINPSKNLSRVTINNKQNFHTYARPTQVKLEKSTAEHTTTNLTTATST